MAFVLNNHFILYIAHLIHQLEIKVLITLSLFKRLISFLKTIIIIFSLYFLRTISITIHLNLMAYKMFVFIIRTINIFFLFYFDLSSQIQRLNTSFKLFWILCCLSLDNHINIINFIQILISTI